MGIRCNGMLENKRMTGGECYEREMSIVLDGRHVEVAKKQGRWGWTRLEMKRGDLGECVRWMPAQLES